MTDVTCQLGGGTALTSVTMDNCVTNNQNINIENTTSIINGNIQIELMNFCNSWIGEPGSINAIEQVTVNGEVCEFTYT